MLPESKQKQQAHGFKGRRQAKGGNGLVERMVSLSWWSIW